MKASKFSDVQKAFILKQGNDLWAYQRGVALDFSRRGNRPTMPSSKPSMAASEPNASTPIGSCPLRTPGKRWRLGADTTMRNGPTGRSAIGHRFCCKITPAPPARQRDEKRKTLVPGGPSSVSLHSPNRTQMLLDETSVAVQTIDGPALTKQTARNDIGAPDSSNAPITILPNFLCVPCRRN